MEPVSIFVFYDNNAIKGQMAEAYLNFYGGRKVVVHSAGLGPVSIHPLAQAAMENDGIELTGRHSGSFENLPKYLPDYILIMDEEVEKSLPKHLTEGTQIIYYQAETNFDGTPEAFEKLRDSIKIFVLKFIGQHLMNKKP